MTIKCNECGTGIMKKVTIIDDRLIVVCSKFPKCGNYVMKKWNFENI